MFKKAEIGLAPIFRSRASFAHRSRNEPNELFVSVLLSVFPNRARQGECEKIPDIRFQFLQSGDAASPRNPPTGLKMDDHQIQKLRFRYGCGREQYVGVLGENPGQIPSLWNFFPQFPVVFRERQQVFDLLCLGIPIGCRCRRPQAADDANRLDDVEPVSISPRRKSAHVRFLLRHGH